MPESEPEVVLLAVPARVLVNERLLDGLDGSAVVPRLRSGELSTTVTVILDAVGAASGVVTLAIARHELAEVGRRLLAIATRHSGASDERPVVVDLKVRGRSARVAVTAADPGHDFMNAVMQLVESTNDLRSSERPEL